MEISSRNTNTLARVVYRRLLADGLMMASRNGPVVMIPEPVTIKLTHPHERVNLDPLRDANPFFHLWEALAMLANFNDVGFHAFFAANMRNYSDDGETFNAYYGERLRSHFGFDQLNAVIECLKKDPSSRQAVAQIWDPADFNKNTKDKACNTQLMFRVCPETNRLLMTSINRSNDAVFGGVTGANIVHLSFFQEYVASSLGLSMGNWWHFSNNLHAYEENNVWDRLKARELDGTQLEEKPYPGVLVSLFDWKFNSPETAKAGFDADLELLVGRASSAAADGTYLSGEGITNSFLKVVALPMFNAFMAHKLKDREAALTYAQSIFAYDWKLAARAWLERRYASAPAKQTELNLETK